MLLPSISAGHLPLVTMDTTFPFSGNVFEKKSKGAVSNTFAYNVFGTISKFYRLREKDLEKPQQEQ